MWLLGKKNLKRLNPVLNSAYYLKSIKGLKKFLRYSRQKKYYNNPYNLLSLQIFIAKTISSFEKVVFEGKRQLYLARENKKEEKINDLEIGITSNRQIVRVLKTIADGLAWRVLDFDRPFIRTMSEPSRNPGSVDLDSDDYKILEETAIAIADTRKSKILLNDITNFLRVGDLIEVGKNTIIWESKESSRKLKSAYTIFKKGNKPVLSRQMKRVVDAQIVRDFRKIPLNDDHVIVMDLPYKFDNYLEVVNKVIQEAKANMFSKKELSDCLIVSCTDNEKMINYAIKTGQNVWEKFNDKNNWNKKHRIIANSNLDFFYDENGDIIRSATPYSIYPFSDEDTMRLISGNLFLKSQLDITKVKKILIKSGWEVYDVDLDKSHKDMEKVIPLIKSGKTPGVFIDDTIFTLKRGPFMLQVPMYWVTRIGTEFMKPEVLIKQIETIYNSSRYGVPRKVQPFILGERDVWK